MTYVKYLFRAPKESEVFLSSCSSSIHEISIVVQILLCYEWITEGMCEFLLDSNKLFQVVASTTFQGQV